MTEQNEADKLSFVSSINIKDWVLTPKKLDELKLLNT